MFIYNLNSSIAKENRQQLGTVTVTKNGELKVSPNIVKSLTEDELADLSRRSLDAFSVLLTGTVNKEMFSFYFLPKYDRTSVIYFWMGNKRCIGHILKKNYHLNFESDVPACIRALCTKELNEKKIRYYYNGSYHN